MARTDFSAMDCSIARTLDVVGEPWTLLIIRDTYYGIHRFEDLQAHLGIARNILADRLGKLVARGVLVKRRYQRRPERFEYRLTEAGRDLLPVILAMMRWGDRWTAEGPPPVLLQHRTCGQEITPIMTCSACGEELQLKDLRAARPAGVGTHAGPGADPVGR
jgi:DNA-binding HxlR family transcriptional regulator